MTTDVPMFHYPATDLTGKAKKAPCEVKYAVSYRYNGGTTIDGEWYGGYEVPPPVVPEGYELVGLGVGYQMNARPPMATALLRRKKGVQP